MNDSTKLYLIALYLINGVGDKTIALLIEHYNSIENIFLDDEESIINTLKNLLSRNRNKSYNFKKDNLLDRAKKIIDDSQKRDIEIVSIFDKYYPFNLKQIDNPPYILYMKGNKNVIRRNSISIVGTRNAQKSSMDYAFELASTLSALNITVVSGFARGIDTAAHLGALSAGSNTVAVFGCGLDYIYPPENAKIYNKMAEHSLLISEFPVGTKAERGNFPRRNRIISGMSYATVMVEASERSGALITTNYALEHGRDVFIAPYEESKPCFMGNHRLYKDGATIAHSYLDIVEDFDNMFSMDKEYIKMKNRHFEGGIINTDRPSNKSEIKIKPDTNASIESDSKNTDIKINYDNFNENEKLVLMVISENDNIHIDNISEKINRPMKDLAMILMQLEIKGIIRQNAGKSYILEGK